MRVKKHKALKGKNVTLDRQFKTTYLINIFKHLAMYNHNLCCTRKEIKRFKTMDK